MMVMGLSPVSATRVQASATTFGASSTVALSEGRLWQKDGQYRGQAKLVLNGKTGRHSYVTIQPDPKGVRVEKLNVTEGPLGNASVESFTYHRNGQGGFKRVTTTGQKALPTQPWESSMCDGFVRMALVLSQQEPSLDAQHRVERVERATSPHSLRKFERERREHAKRVRDGQNHTVPEELATSVLPVQPALYIKKARRAGLFSLPRINRWRLRWN